MKDYFGEYATFEVASKKESGILLGADNMVGDIYDISIELQNGIYKAWIDNRFGQRIGYFDPDESRNLSLAAADGLVLKAILSFVAFTNHPGEGHYWGGMAIIGYNPVYKEEFSVFINGVSKKISDDIRPKLDFGKEGIEKIIESNGEWIPTQTIPLPEVNKGMAILKRKRKMMDKLIEQGRSKNKGCYVASWIFLLCLVALIVFIAKSCVGF